MNPGALGRRAFFPGIYPSLWVGIHSDTKNVGLKADLQGCREARVAGAFHGPTYNDGRFVDVLSARDSQCWKLRRLPISVSSSFQYCSHCSYEGGSTPVPAGACARKRSYKFVNASTCGSSLPLLVVTSDG